MSNHNGGKTPHFLSFLSFPCYPPFDNTPPMPLLSAKVIIKPCHRRRLRNVYKQEKNTRDEEKIEEKKYSADGLYIAHRMQECTVPILRRENHEKEEREGGKEERRDG